MNVIKLLCKFWLGLVCGTVIACFIWVIILMAGTEEGKMTIIIIGGVLAAGVTTVLACDYLYTH